MGDKTLPHVRRVQLRPIDRTKGIDWIAQHRNEYLGQWVILDGDRLISHGDDPQSLLKNARSAGIERPLVVRIEEEPAAYVGGWLWTPIPLLFLSATPTRATRL